mgnify:CR=1 FL=1
MRIKKSCNCRSEELTEQKLKDFIFFTIQQANKNKKERCLVIDNGQLVDIQKEIAEAYNYKIVAYVPPKSKINDIKLLQELL